MNFLIDFSFIVSGVTDPQYIIPHYTTNWNEQSLSNLDLNVDWINNDILKPNGCVFVTATHGDEYTIGNIQLQNFALVQSPLDIENSDEDKDASAIDQITQQKQFEEKLLRWFESLDHVKCYRKVNGRRLLFTSKQANELIHITETEVTTPHKQTMQQDIDSYSLRKINKLRRAEGMDSWQTELANNPEPFGINSAKFNSRLITYLPRFGTPKMTKYSTIRRLLDDAINSNTDSHHRSVVLWCFKGMVIVILALVCLKVILFVVLCARVLEPKKEPKSLHHASMPIPMSPVSVEVVVI